MTLNHIFINALVEVNFINPKKNINYLMYMVDIELFDKIEKKIKSLIQSVTIYSLDIGIKFVKKMCHANNEKQKTTNDGWYKKN